MAADNRSAPGGGEPWGLPGEWRGAGGTPGPGAPRGGGGVEGGVLPRRAPPGMAHTGRGSGGLADNFPRPRSPLPLWTPLWLSRPVPSPLSRPAAARGSARPLRPHPGLPPVPIPLTSRLAGVAQPHPAPCQNRAFGFRPGGRFLALLQAEAAPASPLSPSLSPSDCATAGFAVWSLQTPQLEGLEGHFPSWERAVLPRPEELGCGCQRMEEPCFAPGTRGDLGGRPGSPALLAG